MNKTATTLSIMLALLISGTAFTGLATANPIWKYEAFFPQSAITTSPSVVVFSPINNETYHSQNVTLTFKIFEPDRWFKNAEGGNYLDNTVVGNISSVYYVLNDGKPENLAVPEVRAFSITNGSLPTYLSYSVSLNLTAGTYNLQIYVKAYSCYISNPFDNKNGLITIEVNTDPVGVNFTVALAPQPVIVAPESITYNESSIPLVFTLDNSTASWVGYSLDGKSNITLSGNTTLTGLSNGYHNVTIYANDSFGNAASQLVNFTVSVPASTFPNVPVASASAAVAFVCAGVILYFRKHRRSSLV